VRTTASRPVAAVAAIVLLATGASAAAGHYTIRDGDTLSSIAGRHGVSTAALAEANGITDLDRIYAGRTLAIPGGAPAAGQPPPAPASGSTHVVRAGDTLSGIAARYGLSLRALADANGIVDVHLIRIGTRLGIPASDLAPTGAAEAAPVSRGGLPARLQASPERLALIPIFERWAAAYGVPVDLLMAMTWLESGWQIHVVSSVGALGIGQLMPDTVAFVNDVLLGTNLDPSVPEHNIRMSARFLRWLLDRTGGDVSLALAGYYQGLGSVRARGVFPSTAAYVRDVQALRERNFASK
jgi:LysM repeat protein